MLVNKVANSKLITIKLEDFFPDRNWIIFDIKSYLFRELILKEKDFRESLEVFDWDSLKGKHLIVTCSVEAIIPTWAYMLIAVKAQEKAASVFFGTEKEYILSCYRRWMETFDFSKYEGSLTVLKGCSEKPVPSEVYGEFSAMLSKYARSVMFGEPCSTVPVFKRKK